MLFATMSATFYAALLKPVALLLFLGALLCVRYAIIWWMPEGKLKRFLLIDVSSPDSRRDHRPRQGGVRKLLQ